MGFRPTITMSLLLAWLCSSCAPSRSVKPSEAAAPAACEGSLALSIEVHYMPHGGFLSFKLNEDGQFTFSSPGEDGKQAMCSGRLSESSALRSRLASLDLHTLPLKTVAPVRDGTAIVVRGSCGSLSIDTIAKNTFPPNLRTLTDTVNELVLETHCEATHDLPSGADLLDWADTTGATELCEADCQSCNTCRH